MCSTGDLVKERNDWLIDWLNDRLTDRPIDLLIDWIFKLSLSVTSWRQAHLSMLSQHDHRWERNESCYHFTKITNNRRKPIVRGKNWPNVEFQTTHPPVLKFCISDCRLCFKGSQRYMWITGVHFVTNLPTVWCNIYKTRCPTLFHTERHQSSFMGNFHIVCHRNENEDGFVVFCGDLSFHWYIGR